MKYCVHLTAPITTTPKADNHRGEPRLERNIFDALITGNRTVHATNGIWLSQDPCPPNLCNGLNTDWLDDSTLISYGVPKSISTGYFPVEAEQCKYKIIHYQDGPSHETKDTFLKFDRANPGSIVATTSFQAWEYQSRLEKVLGKENVEWVYGPTVPFTVDTADNFNQPVLLWAYRNFCKYADERPREMKMLFDWIAVQLYHEPNLRLVILAQPNNESSKLALQGDKLQWFLNFPFASSLKNKPDQVKVLTNIHWHEMLEIMKETRLIVSPAEPLGGPPFEAAMYGIPTVLENGTNPFHDRNRQPLFPGLLTAPAGISNPWLEQIGRLFHDHDFYIKHGSAYRSFVKEHATYQAYLNQIDAISKKRGWM